MPDKSFILIGSYKNRAVMKFLSHWLCIVLAFAAHVLFFINITSHSFANELPTAEHLPKTETPTPAPNHALKTPATQNYAKKYPPLAWQELGQGLKLGKSSVSQGQITDNGFVILEIEPEFFDFTLCMASQNSPSRPLSAWAQEAGLVAAINASMYLPDELTSTGYMRNLDHVNNTRMGAKLGAFFVANPKENGLPKVAILEGHNQETKDLLEKYEIVVQNYRLISKQGAILWAYGTAQHSIAAVAEDGQGHILFIMHQLPIKPKDFAEALQRFELDLRTVMYVEGGSKAGLVVRENKAVVKNALNPAQADKNITSIESDGADSSATPKTQSNQSINTSDLVVSHVFQGRASLLVKKEEARIPNILGITPLKTE